MPPRRLTLALLLLCLALPGRIFAADASPSGYVDWERQVAVGVGAAPVRQNAAGASQARAMAQRAAMLDARRNLLEVVGQVRVDSVSVVQNFMAVSDRVTTTVQGLLAGATVAAERLRPDGTYEVTLTVPLSGPLTQELLAAGPPAGAPPQAAAGSEAALANRLAQAEAQETLVSNHAARLEIRVASLERSAPDQAAGTHAAALAAADAALANRILQLESRVALLAGRMARLEARVAALERRAPAGPAAGEQGPAPAATDAALANRLAQLESRIALLAGQAARLETRVSALERNAPAATQAAAPGTADPAQAAPPASPAGAPQAPADASPAPAAAPAGQIPAGLVQAFTGLVVDARGTEFAPSLKPGLFAGKEQLYPGPAVDQSLAVRRGVVRYYRDLAKAQQSREVGASPKTVKAASGSPGALDLDPADAALLRAVLAQPGNFLDQCKVVVVF
ncbi:MAG: hypothetical protein AB1916_07950 [Thermodesulfobacteriota bacterium]